MDTFHFVHLDLTVYRGNMGEPSKVELGWLVCKEDGEDHKHSLILTCDLVINHEDARRELVIRSASGDEDAVIDWMQYVREFHRHHELIEVTYNGEYEDDRLHDVAEGLGKALLLGDYKSQYPDLWVVYADSLLTKRTCDGFAKVKPDGKGMLTDDKIKALAALCKRWDELDKERDDIKDKIERLLAQEAKSNSSLY